MPVQIVLDQPHTVWTNLDLIKGKVILRLNDQSSITSIIVKLEGESRTKLIPQSPIERERQRPQEELHKVLYKTTTVFPPPDVAQSSNLRAFTLSAGSYEYPFEFKVPINNSCFASNPQPMSFKLKNIATSVSSSGLKGYSDARQDPQHIKTTLPPTITSLPGMAEIRYFVKVTVNRKEFYKENPRQALPLNFLPIEPPRPAMMGTQTETYARRRHDFGSGKQPKRGLFASLRGQSSKAGPPSVESTAPAIAIDARLPNPPILTCNRDVPLRLLLRRLNQSTGTLFLHSLQITLTGITDIRAQQIAREERGTWMLFSRTNIGQAILSAKQTAGMQDEDLVIDLQNAGWRQSLLPNSVAPSFETCNIKRRYELDVEVGIGWGDGDSAARNHCLYQLKHLVQIYSGIAPPPELLASVHARPPKSSSIPPRKPVRPPRPAGTENYPPSGSSGPLGFEETSIAEQFGASPAILGDDEPPPPSYEDALGSNLPPVAGAERPRYEPPPVQEDQVRWSSDRKGS